MNKVKSILIGVALFTTIASCSRTFYTCPNEGIIEIKINVIAGKDGKIRTSDSTIIGTINCKGKVFDLAGNKIGERKPTTKELMKDFQEDQLLYE